MKNDVNDSTTAPTPSNGTKLAPKADDKKSYVPERKSNGEATEFVFTSGQVISCLQNTTCYNYREPNEWCPLPDGAEFV